MNNKRVMSHRLRCLLPIIAILLLPLTTQARLEWPVRQEVLNTTAGYIRNLGNQEQIGGFRVAMPAEIHRFYQSRHFHPAWVDADGIRLEAARLLQVLEGAREDGMEPNDYHYTLLLMLVNGSILDEMYLAQLDILLTDAFLHYARDARNGRYSLAEIDPNWQIRTKSYPFALLLEQVLAGEHELGSMLNAMQPYQTAYRRLRSALSSYRFIAARGGWLQVPEGGILRVGSYSYRVSALRERLHMSGDLAENRGDRNRFTHEVEQAVKRFQQRHGLAVDGVVGEQTLAALNVPVGQRIQQLLVNMERWRWMPQDYPWRYLLINMAGYDLSVMEMGREIDRMRVIVGNNQRQTPSMKKDLTAVMLNPPWYVPPTILKEDILPRLEANPSYLKANGMKLLDAGGQVISPDSIDWQQMGLETFPYAIRQEPGPQNPLGRIKFVLDNSDSIYLHDTPKRYLFDKNERALSSGCIRLERPVELAEYILQEEGIWSVEQIQGAIDEGKTRKIALGEPLPVYLVYFTAWVDGFGEVNFRNDVYERDRLFSQAIAEGWEHYHR